MRASKQKPVFMAVETSTRLPHNDKLRIVSVRISIKIFEETSLVVGTFFDKLVLAGVGENSPGNGDPRCF